MNLHYTTKELSEILSARLEGNGDSLVRQLIIDSRNFFGSENTCFLAIIGAHLNGHDYINTLIESGCKTFIVNESEFSQFSDYKATFIIVKDTIKALQELAKHHRKQFDYPVLAITGSNGKTIVKEWLYHVLKDEFNIIRSPKSYNSQIGVPLSLLQLNSQHNLAIIEAGISLPGEMDILEDLIQPSFGILTHIGSAHSKNFERKEDIRFEKIKLFQNTQWFLDFSNVEIYLKEVIETNHGSYITIKFDGENYNYAIPFKDDASVRNSVSVVVTALQLGISFEKISTYTKDLPSIALRLETTEGIDNNIIINDSYSNDLNSLEIALRQLCDRSEKGKKILILSDIEQDFHSNNELYARVADIIKGKDIDQFIGIGEQISSYQHLFENAKFFNDVEDFITTVQKNRITNSSILIKGARKFRFERIAQHFEKQTHETKLTIDLNLIRQNVGHYRAKLDSDVKMLCMIKAFGYGSGSKELGKTLQQAKVDYLGVAYVDEGEELRSENIDLPIIVMNAEKGAFNKIIQNKLEPSIFSFKQLDEFIRTLILHGLKSYPIHLKIDTGMRRLGFTSDEIHDLISMLSSQPEVRVKSIFTHLAASDDPVQDIFTTKQLQSFRYICHEIESGVGYTTIKHALNTAGIERFPHAQLDMVRLGLGLYGISDRFDLSPIGTLSTVISQIKKVPKGESIGYGRAQYATEDMVIGIIPIGYADGFSRTLSCGVGDVYVNGKMAKVAGRVCMDMTMIDITNIEAKEGDEVEIFGKHKSITTLAKQMKTITYEVMTSISKRVQRVYLND